MDTVGGSHDEVLAKNGWDAARLDEWNENALLCSGRASIGSLSEASLGKGPLQPRWQLPLNGRYTFASLLVMLSWEVWRLTLTAILHRSLDKIYSARRQRIL